MPEPLAIEPYTPADRAACLRLFDGNAPDFFALDERTAFAAFLDELPGPFWVARDERGRVIGGGGVSLAAAGRTAWLRWGLVAAAHHRRGIGRALLAARLEWIAAQPAVEVIRVATTGKVAPFFTRMGFGLARVRDDAYGPGLARHDLELWRDR